MTGDELEVEAEISRQLDALGGELQAAARRLRNAPYCSIEQFLIDAEFKLRHIQIAADCMKTKEFKLALGILDYAELPQVELLDDESYHIESTEGFASLL
jgi:hypothetical protein